MTDKNQKLRDAIKRLLKAHRITVQAPPKTITEAENQLREIENAVKYAEEAIATTEPEPIMELGETLTPEQLDELWGRYPEVREYLKRKMQEKAGYKHGAWGGDARDAERYRWLRDDTDSDWAICEWSHVPGDEGYYRDARAPHIVDAAIDAAMAQGVKG